MKFSVLTAVMSLLIGCATTPPPHEPPQIATTSPTTRPQYRDLDVHARSSLFSGTKLPPIVVNWRGDPVRRPYTVHTTYYDATYRHVTAATQPGRYGAIVELTTNDGGLFRHELSLFRFPEPVNWDYVRLPQMVHLPKSFGINNAVVPEQQENFSEFMKYMLQRDAGRTSFPAMVLAGLYEAKPAGEAFVARNGFEALDQKWWAGLKRKLNLPKLPYLVHLPKDYATQPSEKFPLILFLHGSGECGAGGEDLAKVKKPGNLAGMADSLQGLPGGDRFIVISPQCPYDADWSPYDLERLMEEVESTYHVDPDREYLTGLSLGGYGTWDTAIAFPHRWAAIAPMSGAGDPNDVERIKNIPCWIFHGAKDAVVPVEESYRMYNALVKIHGRVKLTIEPEAGHDSWNQPYHDSAFFGWLMQQRRGAAAQPPSTGPATIP
jgi:predicted esterase